MPNGGPTPDCVHCAHFRGEYGGKGPWICTQHMIRLAIPIRLFCSAYLDPEPNEQGDWLDQKLTRADLDDTFMYIWIDWSEEKDRESKGISSTFESFPLVAINQYKQWSDDMVMNAVRQIADEKRSGLP